MDVEVGLDTIRSFSIQDPSPWGTRFNPSIEDPPLPLQDPLRIFFLRQDLWDLHDAQGVLAEDVPKNFVRSVGFEEIAPGVGRGDPVPGVHQGRTTLHTQHQERKKKKKKRKSISLT